MSDRFPRDAPLERVLRTLASLGSAVVREGNHLARRNADGTLTPMTLPNHRTIKGPTLRAVLRQSGIDRDAFLAAYTRD